MFNGITDVIIRQSKTVIRRTATNVSSLPPFIPIYTQPPIRNKITDMDRALYFSSFSGLNFLMIGRSKNGTINPTPAVAIL